MRGRGLYGVLLPSRKGYGVGVLMGFAALNAGLGSLNVPTWVGDPMGFCCPIGRDLGSEFLWGFVATAKGFGVGVSMGFAAP